MSALRASWFICRYRGGLNPHAGSLPMGEARKKLLRFTLTARIAVERQVGCRQFAAPAFPKSIRSFHLS